MKVPRSWFDVCFVVACHLEWLWLACLRSSSFVHRINCWQLEYNSPSHLDFIWIICFKQRKHPLILTDNFKNNIKCGYIAKEKCLSLQSQEMVFGLDHILLSNWKIVKSITQTAAFVCFHLRWFQLSKNEHCQHVVICTFFCISDAKHSSSAILILWKLQVFIFDVDARQTGNGYDCSYHISGAF